MPLGLLVWFFFFHLYFFLTCDSGCHLMRYQILLPFCLTFSLSLSLSPRKNEWEENFCPLVVWCRDVCSNETKWMSCPFRLLWLKSNTIHLALSSPIQDHWHKRLQEKEREREREREKQKGREREKIIQQAKRKDDTHRLGVLFVSPVCLQEVISINKWCANKSPNDDSYCVFTGHTGHKC